MLRCWGGFVLIWLLQLCKLQCCVRGSRTKWRSLGLEDDASIDLNWSPLPTIIVLVVYFVLSCFYVLYVWLCVFVMYCVCVTVVCCCVWYFCLLCMRHCVFCCVLCVCVCLCVHVSLCVLLCVTTNNNNKTKMGETKMGETKMGETLQCCDGMGESSPFFCDSLGCTVVYAWQSYQVEELRDGWWCLFTNHCCWLIPLFGYLFCYCVLFSVCVGFVVWPCLCFNINKKYWFYLTFNLLVVWPVSLFVLFCNVYLVIYFILFFLCLVCM